MKTIANLQKLVAVATGVGALKIKRGFISMPTWPQWLFGGSKPADPRKKLNSSGFVATKRTDAESTASGGTGASGEDTQSESESGKTVGTGGNDTESESGESGRDSPPGSVSPRSAAALNPLPEELVPGLIQNGAADYLDGKGLCFAAAAGGLSVNIIAGKHKDAWKKFAQNVDVNKFADIQGEEMLRAYEERAESKAELKKWRVQMWVKIVLKMESEGVAMGDKHLEPLCKMYKFDMFRRKADAIAGQKTPAQSAYDFLRYLFGEFESVRPQYPDLPKVVYVETAAEACKDADAEFVITKSVSGSNPQIKARQIADAVEQNYLPVALALSGKIQVQHDADEKMPGVRIPHVACVHKAVEGKGKWKFIDTSRKHYRKTGNKLLGKDIADVDVVKAEVENLKNGRTSSKVETVGQKVTEDFCNAFPDFNKADLAKKARDYAHFLPQNIESDKAGFSISVAVWKKEAIKGKKEAHIAYFNATHRFGN